MIIIDYLHRAKTVFVHAYYRFRLGKWEHVRSHFRRPPLRGWLYRPSAGRV